MSGSLPPCRVAGEFLEQVFPCGGKFVSDEAQPEEPAPEGVFRIVGDRARRAGRFGAQRLCADGEAQLDVGFDLARVECAAEGAELDGVRGALGGEGRVEVEQVVAAVVVCRWFQSRYRKSGFSWGFAPFAWSLRFPAGLFARPARRDTFITLRRRKSNPTEATRIRAQNSSDLTRAAPGKKRFLIRQKRAFSPACRPDRRGGLKPYTSRAGCSRFARAAARRPALRRARAAPAKTACAAPAEAHRRQCAAARLTPAKTARAAFRCGPKGGSNPWAVPAGDRGPLSCEFSQNSGVGVSPQKNKNQPPFFGRLFA